jgi:hypothetical protein
LSSLIDIETLHDASINSSSPKLPLGVELIIPIERGF